MSDEHYGWEGEITKMFGCKCEFEHMELIDYRTNSRNLWQADVKVFALLGHTDAASVYVWDWKDERNEIHSIVKLGRFPISSAVEAVRDAVNRDEFKCI